MRRFSLEIWGDYACFTRPEIKTERMSYPVITPSAARNIFRSVFWKPPVEWAIETIEILKPIEWTTVRRNEVSEVVSTTGARAAMKNGSGRLGLYVEEARQQRAALILKDVKYRITARLEVDPAKLGPEENPEKFYAMFTRRAKAGQVFHRPYLGCREFAANYQWIDGDATDLTPPIAESRDFGFMLFDFDYSNPDSPRPMFFDVHMQDGVIQVPSRYSEEVKR